MSQATQDMLSKETRSRIMSKIRKTDTKPELAVRKFLFRRGFRYRLYRSDLPGNPDIVLSKHKLVIFINGCFWHAHQGCKLNRMPKTRREYWVPKINRTVERDVINHAEFRRLGWNVIVIWECQLKKDKFEPTMNTVIKTIFNHLTRK